MNQQQAIARVQELCKSIATYDSTNLPDSTSLTPDRAQDRLRRLEWAASTEVSFLTSVFQWLSSSPLSDAELLAPKSSGTDNGPDTGVYLSGAANGGIEFTEA